MTTEGKICPRCRTQENAKLQDKGGHGAGGDSGGHETR